jgi:Reverse transcriptase (RNA-dependent DNA polymerase)
MQGAHPLYVVNASDLQPLHPSNKLVKYADDTYLLVGAMMRFTIEEELAHVAEWAEKNNLRLNTSKSREMLVTRRGLFDSPDLIKNVERVTSMKILGVTLQNNLHVSQHVDEILSACSSSLYALRVLRTHGLPCKAMHTVTEATTVARLMYASPAWWGLTTFEDKQRMERLLRRAQRMGYLPEDAASAEERATKADEGLFRAVNNNVTHVLRCLFPPLARRAYSLRQRPHDFMLPIKDDRNFIPRTLYRRADNPSFASFLLF